MILLLLEYYHLITMLWQPVVTVPTYNYYIVLHYVYCRLCSKCSYQVTNLPGDKLQRGVLLSSYCKSMTELCGIKSNRLQLL